MFLILFYIKNFVKSNSYSYYSTFVPPRKTLTLSLYNPSASLARRITPATLRLSASARFFKAQLTHTFYQSAQLYRLTSCCPKTMPNHCSRNKKQTA